MLTVAILYRDPQKKRLADDKNLESSDDLLARWLKTPYVSSVPKDILDQAVTLARENGLACCLQCGPDQGRPNLRCGTQVASSRGSSGDKAAFLMYYCSDKPRCKSMVEHYMQESARLAHSRLSEEEKKNILNLICTQCFQSFPPPGYRCICDTAVYCSIECQNAHLLQHIKHCPASRCSSCHQTFPLELLKACSRCKRVHYCSVKCQKQDWIDGGHKLKCKPRD